MTTRRIRIFFAAVLTGVSLGLAASAGAQGLARSDQLSVISDPTQPVALATSRCAGFNWVTSLGTCSWSLLTRIASAARPEGDARQPSDAPLLAFEPLVPRAGLPVLAISVPTSTLRSGGGNESLAGQTRAADLLFRFSSTNHARNADGGRDWSRFSDVTQESRRQGSLPKVVGVELLVPFQ